MSSRSKLTDRAVRNYKKARKLVMKHRLPHNAFLLPTTSEYKKYLSKMSKKELIGETGFYLGYIQALKSFVLTDTSK